jgi:hypothetical protein
MSQAVQTVAAPGTDFGEDIASCPSASRYQPWWFHNETAIDEIIAMKFAPGATSLRER